jgi:hypothetical protein
VRSRGVKSTILTVPRSHHEGEINLEVNRKSEAESSDRKEIGGPEDEVKAKI